MNDTAESWHFRSVALPALLMLLSAPGHFSVLPICLQKYYLCSWGEGRRSHLPSPSAWGIRVASKNKLFPSLSEGCGHTRSLPCKNLWSSIMVLHFSPKVPAVRLDKTQQNKVLSGYLIPWKWPASKWAAQQLGCRTDLAPKATQSCG